MITTSLRTLLVLSVVPIVILSLGKTSQAAPTVVSECTVTKLSHDGRLLFTCADGSPAGSPTDFVGFPPGSACMALTTDMMSMFHMIVRAALYSGKPVNLTYEPTCQNAIYGVEIFKKESEH